MPLLRGVRGGDQRRDDHTLQFGPGFWTFFLLGRDGGRLMATGGGDRRRSRRRRVDGGVQIGPSEGEGPMDV